METSGSTDNRIVAELDSAQAAVNRHQRRLLELVAECDRRELWTKDGSCNLATWLSARLGISNWSARRHVTAAHALPSLPQITAAFEAGLLCLDKVLELCRFATSETEAKLVTWARKVTVTGIRRRADQAHAPDKEEVLEADRARYLHYWWFEDGKRFGLEASLPADQGAVVAKALDRLADRMPDILDDDYEPVSYVDSLETRRADALFALASAQLASDQDPDRATIVVQAPLDALVGGDSGCIIEGGPVVHPDTALRLSCDCRVEVVLNDGEGNAVGIGRTSRNVPRWLRRQLRYRDGACAFPGCESRFYLHAHHIIHWVRGGRTDLDNLVLVCTFHHKLVHEYGWDVRLGEQPGTAIWYRPGGRPLEVGKDPPLEVERRVRDHSPAETIEGAADLVREFA